MMSTSLSNAISLFRIADSTDLARVDTIWRSKTRELYQLYKTGGFTKEVLNDRLLELNEARELLLSTSESEVDSIIRHEMATSDGNHSADSQAFLDTTDKTSNYQTTEDLRLAKTSSTGNSGSRDNSKKRDFSATRGSTRALSYPKEDRLKISISSFFRPEDAVDIFNALKEVSEMIFAQHSRSVFTGGVELSIVHPEDSVLSDNALLSIVSISSSSWREMRISNLNARPDVIRALWRLGLDFSTPNTTGTSSDLPTAGFNEVKIPPSRFNFGTGGRLDISSDFPRHKYYDDKIRLTLVLPSFVRKILRKRILLILVVIALGVWTTPKSSQYHFDRAYQMHEAGDMTGAKAEYSVVIGIDPQGTYAGYAYYNRGLIYQAWGDMERACNDWSSAYYLGHNDATQLMQDQCSEM